MELNASLIKRYAACLYEALSLIAIWLFCTVVFMVLFGDIDTVFKRHLLQITLWVITGVYFVACWMKTGQSLAMQAWKIKLVNKESGLLDLRLALLRYVLATISFSFFCVGFFWPLIDKQRLFLHDRLLKTRLIQSASN